METKTLTSAIIFISLFFISAVNNQEPQLDLKKIEKSMAKISDRMYACKYEACNLEYRFFLNDLRANNKNDELKKAIVDSLGWRMKHQYLEPFVENYHSHPAYNNYPAVNISYEAAILFCDWLTEKYNSWSGRNFKKVKFRLPSEQEWELAARGGKENENYPFGNFLRNEKGMMQCNFRMIGDERVTCNNDSNKYEVIGYNKLKLSQQLADGAAILAPVQSYWANGFGIYNMSGNAAEMVQTKGIARGGSWLNTGYDVRTESKSAYEKSSAAVGFRYFMEVVE